MSKFVSPLSVVKSGNQAKVVPPKPLEIISGADTVLGGVGNGPPVNLVFDGLPFNLSKEMEENMTRSYPQSLSSSKTKKDNPLQSLERKVLKGKIGQTLLPASSVQYLTSKKVLTPKNVVKSLGHSMNLVFFARKPVQRIVGNAMDYTRKKLLKSIPVVGEMTNEIYELKDTVNSLANAGKIKGDLEGVYRAIKTIDKVKTVPKRFKKIKREFNAIF